MNSMVIFAVTYLVTVFAIYSVAMFFYRKKLINYGGVSDRVKTAMNIFVGLACPIGFLGTMIVGGYIF